jgi:hypothetical protein
MSQSSRDGKTQTTMADAPGGLDGIARAVREHQQDVAHKADAPPGAIERKRGPAPVHLWNPPFCGDLDIRIARDGTWYYLGTPIGRQPLVQLFASVLRKDEDGKTYLVTPVEKIGIIVEDAPFVAVDVEQGSGPLGPVLTFETNLGDRVELGPEHPLRVVIDTVTDEPRPYILVRGRLEALIDRKTFYRLAAIGEMRHEADGGTAFGLVSNGAFFAIQRGDSLDALVAEGIAEAPRS